MNDGYSVPAAQISQLQRQKSVIRITPWIPRAARSSVSEALTDILSSLCRNPIDESNWVNLISFANSVLALPGEKVKGKSLATVIKANLSGAKATKSVQVANKSKKR